MNDFWYYEYTVTFWDDIDNKEETRRGVVPAESITAALEQLEKYYGKINEIHLKSIIEGMVLEFEEAAEIFIKGE